MGEEWRAKGGGGTRGSERAEVPLCVRACEGRTPAHTHFLFGGPGEDLCLSTCVVVFVCGVIAMFLVFLRAALWPTHMGTLRGGYHIRLARKGPGFNNGFKLNGEAADL